LPHVALRDRLAERLGLDDSDWSFNERFHPGLDFNVGNVGNVQRVAAPFLVQRELEKQRAFVRFHYDFIYVLRLNPGVRIARESSDLARTHTFVDLAQLREMVIQRQSFPDVLDAYTRVVGVAGKQSP